MNLTNLNQSLLLNDLNKTVLEKDKTNCLSNRSQAEVNRTDRNIVYNYNVCDSSRISEYFIKNKRQTNQNSTRSKSKSPIYGDIKFPKEKRISQNDFYSFKKIKSINEIQNQIETERNEEESNFQDYEANEIPMKNNIKSIKMKDKKQLRLNDSGLINDIEDTFLSKQTDAHPESKSNEVERKVELIFKRVNLGD